MFIIKDYSSINSRSSIDSDISGSTSSSTSDVADVTGSSCNSIS